MATRRKDRVAEAIKRLISEIVQRELKDPRLSGFITITKVEVTADLRLAKIFYSVLGDEKTKKQIKGGLESARSYMRGRIADELKLRYAPEILLCVDKTFEYRDRIDEILGNIKKEKRKVGRHERDSKNS